MQTCFEECQGFLKPVSRVQMGNFLGQYGGSGRYEPLQSSCQEKDPEKLRVNEAWQGLFPW